MGSWPSLQCLVLEHIRLFVYLFHICEIIVSKEEAEHQLLPQRGQ